MGGAPRPWVGSTLEISETTRSTQTSGMATQQPVCRATRRGSGGRVILCLGVFQIARQTSENPQSHQDIEEAHCEDPRSVSSKD